MFAACPVSTYGVTHACSSMACHLGDHYVSMLHCQEKQKDSGMLNDKTGYRNGTMPSFQMSSSSVYSILMHVHLFGNYEETAHLLGFINSIRTLHLM